DAVGDGGSAGDGDALSRVEGGPHARYLLALDADDTHGGLERLESHRHASGQPAASHGDHHRLEVGDLVHQLEGNGALAGDDARVVEGMNEDEAALRLDLARPRISRVVVV